jgi:hypothetical protein
MGDPGQSFFLLDDMSIKMDGYLRQYKQGSYYAE